MMGWKTKILQGVITNEVIVNSITFPALDSQISTIWFGEKQNHLLLLAGSEQLMLLQNYRVNFQCISPT